MTTTGRTTRCSSNRPMAAGSASRTLVSRTYVRRTEELATRSLPWAPGGAVFGHIGLARAEARVQENVSAGPGPASTGPGAGPSLISPACQDAKLEDLEGLPVGRLGTARHLRRYPRSAVSRKYRAPLLTCLTSARPPGCAVVRCTSARARGRWLLVTR